MKIRKKYFGLWLSLLTMIAICLSAPVQADSVNLSDTTPPVFVSLVMNPSTVDVSSGPATFIATVTATDNLNSMNMIDALFDITTFNSVWSTSNTLISQSVIGGLVQAVWQVKMTIPQGISPKIYGLRISIEDAAHNKLFINPAWTSVGDKGNSITVTNNKTSSNIDVSAYDINAQIQQLQAQVSSLQSKLSNASSLQDSLNKSVDAYARQSDALMAAHDQLATQLSQITSLTTQVSTLTSKLSALNLCFQSARSVAVSKKGTLSKQCLKF
jgi:hypothetical protein